MPEHPSVQPWTTFKRLIQPELVIAAERGPYASIEEHLAGRRELASRVVKEAHAVIDAIDRGA